MDTSRQLPPSIAKAQESLTPYIKQRKEAAEIRRILASHLNSCINHKDRSTLSRPLSLLNRPIDSNVSEQRTRGLQKEYLRCVQANNNARREFVGISTEHRQVKDESSDEAQIPQSSNEISSFTDSYLDMIKQRQRHERLRIVQDYVDVLCQKPAASVDQLNPRLVLRDVESLPKVPSEVLDVPSTAHSSSGTDLASLIDRLEKSVLKAKMLLKSEQKALAKVKANHDAPATSTGSRLHALGSARNELILWMETEFACAEDNSPDAQQLSGTSDARGKEYIDAQLAIIHRQYTRYAKSRQRLILAAAGTLETPLTKTVEATANSTDSEEPYESTQAPIALPYLQQIVAISNDQKTIVQQKAHLTTTLIKQFKEGIQELDRLAEESHLLASHPMSAAQSQNKYKEKGTSFEEYISQHEKPEYLHRAKAWVSAADLAGKSTEVSVLESIEDGKFMVERAQGSLETLRKILGSTDPETEIGTDIWNGLDGMLGVINSDGPE